MSTSDRNLYFEAASGAAILVAGLNLLSPGELWPVEGGAHPGWVIVLVLAARYGLRGLFVSLLAIAGSLTALTYATGGHPAELLMHATLAPEVCALTAAVLVAWIGRLHQGKRQNLELRIKETEEQRDEGDETIAAMQESLATLRTRQDRIDISLSLWRELAARLERGDAAEAARATLELCAIRAGATAGIVHGWDGNRLYPLAWRGQWSETQGRPRDIVHDCTALAAIGARRPLSATVVEGASSDDADVAVPVLDEAGNVQAVICLRLPENERLRAAELSDLDVAARWLASALTRPIRSAPQLVPPLTRPSKHQ
jgi:GAF domain